MTTKPKIIDTRQQAPQAQAQTALQTMLKFGITPNPDNYELWYMYAGKHSELCKEVNELKEQNIELNDRVSSRLCGKYVKKAPDDKETAETVAAAMGKLMGMVDKFSNETDAYNAKLDAQTDNLSSKIQGNAALEGLLGEVVGQLKEIQENSSAFGSQMHESQKEILYLRKNLEKATNEARIDGLTNLNNRRSFDELVAEQTETAKDNKTDLCLLMIDIDHFKKFNDTWGHQIGDEVLKVVAGVLRKTVRGQDIVARYGGEEFAIMLPNTPPSGAHIVAENIRTLILKNRLKRKNSTEEIGQITISVGVTRFRANNDDETIESFIKRADDALYEAKETGRNRVVKK